MLGMLEVNPSAQSVYCAAADRGDFYPQLAASRLQSLLEHAGASAPPGRCLEH